MSKLFFFFSQLNEYTLGEIRRLHERLASRQPGAFRARTSLFRDFSRTQKLALSSLCLVDFTCFCSMSIMAPFFPGEVSFKFLGCFISNKSHPQAQLLILHHLAWHSYPYSTFHPLFISYAKSK